MSTATRAGTRADRAPYDSGASQADSTTFLTIYLVVLYAIPSNRTIHALGSAGSVAVVWGLAGVMLWSLYRVQRSTSPTRPIVRPVRIALFLFLFAALVSYVAAMTRALPGDEVSTADTGMIRLAGWAGILLVASDGIPNIHRFLVLIRRCVTAGALVASLGLLQFVTKLSLVDLIPSPGLTVGDSYATLETRGGILRPAGTSNHPLEYGLILAVIFPVAITLALREKNRSWLARWAPPLLIVLALLLSGSRSAIIGLVAGSIVLIPTWSRSIRWGFALAAVAMVGVAYVASPRSITTLRYLFVSVGNDPSAASRSDSLGIVIEFFTRSPFFGRGFGTFLPQYRILDNQYFLLLIEVGLLGAILFVALITTAALSAGIAARGADDPLTQHVGFALVGSVVSGGILLALFDGLSFPQAAGTLFFFVGLCGAYWRLTRREDVVKDSADRPLFIADRH
ncbi:O-antigen ligase family protein [Lacisediminihabitans sp. FW035]